MKNNILIVGPAWVGDMIMADSLFQLIKKQNPHATIDVLAPSWTFSLLARMPCVSSSIVLPFEHGQLDLLGRYALAKSLRKKRYDQAIVLPNSFKSALPVWWANIPIRTGFTGEMRYGVLNDRRHLDKSRYVLMIEQFMALGLPPDAALPDIYPLPMLQVSIEKQKETLLKHRLSFSNEPILALCPGAEFGSAKRWPEKYYADVANKKLKEGWQVWLFGSKKDSHIAEQIMTLTGKRCVNLAGQTHLEEAIDLLALASVVVSNDSGLMHMASALQKPLIVLYGPTSPLFTPPLYNNAKILSLNLACQPCFKRDCPLKHQNCLRQITPDFVLNEILLILLKS